MLGLMSDEAEEQNQARMKLRRKKSASTIREVVDEELCSMTEVKENTLNPVWNETFTM